MVQSGKTSFSLYPDECDGQGGALVAKTFETTIASTTDDWASSGISSEESVPDPEIGGGSAASPITIGPSSVVITISNAVKGHVYHYRKGATLQELMAMTPQPCPAATADGVMTINFERAAGEASQFYQILP